VGTYSIHADYMPGADYTASNDSSKNLIVNLAATATSASPASTAFSTSDQTVTFNATVTSGGGPVNEGDVAFTLFDNTNTQVGTPVTSSTVASGSASVSYTVPANTPVGSYTIKAVYNAGTDYITSTDQTQSLTIS